MTIQTDILDLIKDKKFDEARERLAPLLVIDSQNAENWHAMGCLEMSLNNKEEAIKAIDKAIEIDPMHVRALCNQATLNRSNGDGESAQKARDALARINELAPEIQTPFQVYIGIPHYGASAQAFEDSLLGLIMSIRPQDGIDWMMCRCEGSRITSNRNRLVADARKKKATHILFIDSDMDFPPNALHRLLSHNKDIVGATTCKRGDELGVPIGQAMPTVDTDANDECLKVSSGGGLIRMNAFGCCFMLIKMSVFDKVGLPAFYEPPLSEIEDAQGEDITFCQLARDAGLEIWMDFDLSIELGHWGKKRYHIKPLV